MSNINSNLIIKALKFQERFSKSLSRQQGEGLIRNFVQDLLSHDLSLQDLAFIGIEFKVTLESLPLESPVVPSLRYMFESNSLWEEIDLQTSGIMKNVTRNDFIWLWLKKSSEHRLSFSPEQKAYPEFQARRIMEEKSLFDKEYEKYLNQENFFNRFKFWSKVQ